MMVSRRDNFKIFMYPKFAKRAKRKNVLKQPRNLVAKSNFTKNNLTDQHNLIAQIMEEEALVRILSLTPILSTS